MDGESITHTVRMPKEMLEGVQNLVEEGVYETRTDAIIDAIDLKSRSKTDRYSLMNAGISAYLEADEQDMYEIRDNAKKYIEREFPESRVNELLK